jgi:hypothetical protein
MYSTGWCALTCGRCTPLNPCTDTQPNDGTTCAQKKSWGQCDASWMLSADWCDYTCGRCSGPVVAAGAIAPACKDVQPTDGTTCAQKKQWGQCKASWMTKNNWCAATCGRCGKAPVSSVSCTNKQPPGAFTCAQQKAWGKVRHQSETFLILLQTADSAHCRLPWQCLGPINHCFHLLFCACSALRPGWSKATTAPPHVAGAWQR